MDGNGIEWKEVEGFEGFYWVSSDGQVKNQYGLMKTRKCKRGYVQVTFAREGKQHPFYVHRLVAQAFVKNEDPEHLTCINHIDEDKANNIYTNLEWSNHQRNNTYGSRIRKQMQTREAHRVKHRFRKRPVVGLRLSDYTVMEFDSLSAAARHIGTSSSNISGCCQGYQKTVKGWHFLYK